MPETKTKTKTTDKAVKFSGKYIEAVGRRKESTARVRLYTDDKGNFIVNDKDVKEYFDNLAQRRAAQDASKLTGTDNFSFSVLVKGGGKMSQSEAVRHGIARALIKHNEELRPALKAKGYLTRDARAKERKKPGLKKARRAPQWSKR